MAEPPIVLELGAPFVGSPVPDEDHFQRFSRNAGHGDGIDATVFGTSSGALVVDSGLRQVTVQPYYAHVGGVQAEQSTAVVVDMPLASASDRLDRIVTRREPANNRCVLDVLQGTGGSGVAPVVTLDDTGVWEYSHGVVPVNANGSLGSARDERVLLGIDGRYGLSTARPPDRRTGDDFFEIDTGRRVLWDGSTWVVLYEDTGDVGLSLLDPGYNETTGGMVVRRRTGVTTLRLGLIRATFAPAGGEAHVTTLPTGFRPSILEAFPSLFSNGVVARVEIHPDGRVVVNQSNGGVDAGFTLITSATWVVG